MAICFFDEAYTDVLQEFILRVKKKGDLEYYIGRRYGDFVKLHKKLATELPGRVLPPVPKKNKSSSTSTGLLGSVMGKGDDSDASSVSSVSTMNTERGATESMKNLVVGGMFLILAVSKF